MLPGLQADPAGSVHATGASIALTGGRIVATYTLARTGDVPGHLAIHGPRFGWLGEAEPYPDRQFPELIASLDGAKLPPSQNFAAFAGTLEVGETVRAAGLDPFAIAATPPFVDRLPGAHQAAFGRLLAEHAVEMSDGQALARWTAQRIWRFDLSAQPSAVLSLTYRARPGFALLAKSDIARAIPLGRYCITGPALARRLGGAPDRLLVVKTYAFAVGVDGETPPRVALQVGDGQAVFCAADGSAAFGEPGGRPRPARAQNGVLRVLEISPPG
jgi:hypothetical protein